MPFSSAGQTELSGSGTITALNGTVVAEIPYAGSVAVTITGTWTATLAFEATVNDTDWFAITVSSVSYVRGTTTADNDSFVAAVGGYSQFRVRASAFTSGTATITWNSDDAINPSLNTSALLRNSAGSETGTVTTPFRIDPTGTTNQPVTQATNPWLVRDEPNNQISLGNGYATVQVNLTVGSTETHVLYLKNNSGSKTVYLFNTLLTQDVSNGNNWMNFRVYYGPTVTANGTAATISNLLAGSSNTSASNAYTGPSVSAHGTLVKYWTSGLGNAASPVQDATFSNYFVLPPSQSLLITGTAKANGQGMNATLMWFEV